MRPLPAGIHGFVLRAEPALALRFIDPRGVIGRIIRHMVEALASAVDVTFDAAVGTRRRVARLLPLDVPPLPGWCERYGPHSSAESRGGQECVSSGRSR